MKIGFLLNGFQDNGGIGRVVSILANEMSQKEQYVVSTISYCKTDKPMLYNLSEKISQYALFSENVSMAKALLFKGAIKKVKKIIKENQIDILVACGALYFPLGIRAVKGTNAKCYCWEHTNPATSYDHKFQNVCRKYAIKRADKLVLLTNSAKNYYKETLRAKEGKLVQIYNPVDSSAFVSTQYDEQSKKIVSVGRLSYQKNFECLMRVAKTVLSNNEEWTWDIYGKGEDREKLETLIDEYKLHGKVRLMGQVNDLYNRYQEYAFMVMTSRYEGFPMSLLEGAANRLPLISFDIPTGPNEIIKDGENGYLLRAGDESGLAGKIIRLMDDLDLRKKIAKAVYISVQEFSMDTILAQWNQLFGSKN